MLNYLIAKYYEKMIAVKDEHPVLRTIVYSCVLVFLLLLSFLIPLFTLTERLGLKNRSDRSLELAVFIAIVILIPLFLYYYLIRKKHLEKIVIKYGHHKISRALLNTFLFLVPFLLFFVGPTITVLLFGGSILDYNFKGVLTPYLPGT